ncbi:MAG: hypothetical protein ACLPN1_07140 [Dissulfurispiraceae bacterium]
MKQRKQAIANLFAVIVVTMAFIACPIPGSGAVTWIQGNYGQPAEYAYTVPSVPFLFNNTSNSLLLCSVSCEIDFTEPNTPSGDVTISDSVGNKWMKVTSAYDNYKILDGDYTWQYNSLFYADNTQGTGNRPITVDISGYTAGTVMDDNLIGGDWYCTAMIEEFAAPLNEWLVPDGTVYGFQNGQYTSGTVTLTGPTIAPNANGDLIYAILFDDSSVSGYDTFSAGSGYNLLENIENSGIGNLADEYLVQGTAGSIAPTFNFSSLSKGFRLPYVPEQWTIMAAAFTTTCRGPLIMVEPSGYQAISILEGINDATVSGSVIEVNNYAAFLESPVFSNTVPISLEGGYDCSLDSIVGYSEIDGQVVINGTAAVTIGNIIIGP